MWRIGYALAPASWLRWPGWPRCVPAGIAGAIAIAPSIATTIIGKIGVSTGFLISGAALIVIRVVAALALNRTRGRDAVSSPAGRHMRPALGAPASCHQLLPSSAGGVKGAGHCF